MRAKKEEYGIIVLASATDPYPKIEKKYQITRGILETILKYRFPLHLLTKSALVLRDIEIFRQINQVAILPKDLRSKLKSGLILTFSFSTLDDQIAAIFEPGAPPPSVRLKTMEKLIGEGFAVGVSLMPLLPYISDTTEHLHFMYSAFKKINATYVIPAALTLFGNNKADSKTLVLGAVKKHFPELNQKYKRFFDHSNEMPAYYQKAFYQRLTELSQEFGIPDRIIP